MREQSRCFVRRIVTGRPQGGLLQHQRNTSERYLVAGTSWGDKGAKKVVREIVESLGRDSILRKARGEMLARLCGEVRGV